MTGVAFITDRAGIEPREMNRGAIEGQQWSLILLEVHGRGVVRNPGWGSLIRILMMLLPSPGETPPGASSFTRPSAGVCLLCLVLPRPRQLSAPQWPEHNLRIEREALSGSPGGAFFFGA